MTPICEVSNGGTSTTRWLCAACQAARRARGLSVKPYDGKFAAHPCDDCPREPVAFVPVLTTSDVVPSKRPPAKPMEPWSVYFQRKASEMAKAKGKAA